MKKTFSNQAEAELMYGKTIIDRISRKVTKDIKQKVWAAINESGTRTGIRQSYGFYLCPTRP